MRRRLLPEGRYRPAACQDLPRYPFGKAAQSLRQEESRWRKIRASRLAVVKGILPAEVSVECLLSQLPLFETCFLSSSTAYNPVTFPLKPSISPSCLKGSTPLMHIPKAIRPFRLLRQDLYNLRRRYVSDWTVFNQLVVASAVYVFFTNLLPGITFASDLYVLTGKSWGTIEVVFSTGLCGVIFSL